MGRLCDKPFLIISVLYTAFCLFSAVWWCIGGVVGHVLMSAAFILFIPAMLAAEYLFGMRFGAVFMIAALSIAVGGILGSPFAMYSTVPVFDDILHTISGFVFAALGVALVEFFFGKARSRREAVGAMLLGVFFSLGIAVLWELWEFGGMLLLGMETADDTIVDGFTSFIFHGRSEPVIVEGVLKTVIYYGEGQLLTVDGYLDIGYIDTVGDMIVCTAGALIFLLTSLLAARHPRFSRSLIPEVKPRERACDGPESSADTAAEALVDEYAEPSVSAVAEALADEYAEPSVIAAAEAAAQSAEIAPVAGAEVGAEPSCGGAGGSQKISPDTLSEGSPDASERELVTK